MKANYLKYKDTGRFSKIMIDYLEGTDELKQFVEYENSFDGFKEVINSRNNIDVDRELLVKQLVIQNSKLELSETSENNINILKNKNTFTITTGHQLNLFTGPLYYIYKTASVIKLCTELKQEFPENNFVPVFWMATEDHDFEEINHFQFKGEKLEWITDQKGAVGRMDVKEVQTVYEKFSSKIEEGIHADFLKELFSKTYLEHNNLAEATRYLVNELFGEYGIVLLDGDDRELKKTMIPAFKRELIEFVSDKNLSVTNNKLKGLNHKIQVQQRKINLFYLEDNFRERIVFDSGIYKVLNSEIEFTKEEILLELENYPEKFSPNAILRPLYEEQVLPNLAYVGGGGELAYWFQLKGNFNDFGVSFPILVLRNSLMLINERLNNIIEELKITCYDLFADLHELIKQKVIENSNVDFDLLQEIEGINKILASNLLEFENEKFKHPTFKAQHKKQLNIIVKKQKKLLRAEKKNQPELVAKIELIKSELFPENGLQERKLNFAEMYMEFGEILIPSIIEKISVLNNRFTILRLNKIN